MEAHEVATLARTHMDQHGLEGWFIKIVNVFGVAGRCVYSRRTLEFNAKWCAVASDLDVKNTVLHEIAHALVGPGRGHDYIWHARFLSIGGNGETRASDHGLNATKRFVVQCVDGCENLGYRQRRDPRLLNNKVCRKHRAALRYKENA